MARDYLNKSLVRKIVPTFAPTNRQYCKPKPEVNTQPTMPRFHGRNIAENMEKSHHADFNEDTTNESASVACSNARL